MTRLGAWGDNPLRGLSLAAARSSGQESRCWRRSAAGDGLALLRTGDRVRILEPAVAYQRVAQTKGIPRHNH